MSVVGSIPKIVEEGARLVRDDDRAGVRCWFLPLFLPLPFGIQGALEWERSVYQLSTDLEGPAVKSPRSAYNRENSVSLDVR